MWSDLWNFSETTAKFKMKYIYIDLVQDLKSGFSLCGLVLNKAPKTSLNTFYSNVLSEVLFLNENTKTLQWPLTGCDVILSSPIHYTYSVENFGVKTWTNSYLYHLPLFILLVMETITLLCSIFYYSLYYSCLTIIILLVLISHENPVLIMVYSAFYFLALLILHLIMCKLLCMPNIIFLKDLSFWTTAICDRYCFGNFKVMYWIKMLQNCV